jgi:hypothetical protein
VDTGASFTLISQDTARMFGLQVRPRDGYFVVANGQQARVAGECRVTLQVHDDFQLVLDNVKVQATPGYQFLLGSDILRGANMALEWVDVRPGVHVEWRWGPMRVSYTSPVVNPRGPAGDQVLGAT